MTGTQPADEFLDARAARGDVPVVEDLYNRQAAWIRAWAVRVLGSDRADDALQEVFLWAWRSAAQFDPARGRFAGWIGAITRHHLARQLGRSEPKVEALGVDAIDAALGEDGAEGLVWRRERDEAVRRALRCLLVEQRRVVILAYFAGLTQSQIADHAGIPLGTVKKRVGLAMRKLRNGRLGDGTTHGTHCRSFAQASAAARAFYAGVCGFCGRVPRKRSSAQIELKCCRTYGPEY